jgi:hypothetical protein
MENREIEEHLVRLEYLITELQSDYLSAVSFLERIRDEAKGSRSWIEPLLKNMGRRTRGEIINESRATMKKYFEAGRRIDEEGPEFKKEAQKLENRGAESLNLNELEYYLAGVKKLFGLPCAPESEI